MYNRFTLLIIALPLLFLGAQSRLTYIPVEYSKSQVDSLIALLRSTDDQAKIEIFIKLAYALKKTDPYTALDYGQKGLFLSRSLNDKRSEADILTELGKSYHSIKNYSKELECHLEAYEIRKSIEDNTGIGISLNFIGQTYFDDGKYLDALKYFLESYDYFDNLGDRERTSISANDIGIVNNYLGNYEIALDYYLRALKIKEDIAPSGSMSATYANMGDVYVSLKDFDNAIYYFEKALKFSEFDLSRALIKIKLGSAYQNTSELKKASELLHGSLRILENSKSPVYKSLAYMNLGKYYDKINLPDSALSFFNLALDSYNSYHSKVGRIEAINAIAPLLLKKKKTGEVIALLNSILPYADSLNLKERLRNTLDNLSIAYELAGDYKTALHFKKRSNDIRDSIFSIEKNRQIVSMQLYYQAEKKAKEIETLTTENSYEVKLRNTIIIIAVLLLILMIVISRSYLLKKKEHDELEKKSRLITAQKEMLEETTAELRASIATKDKFFSIISHDLKNPFHSILSVSDLLANSIDKISSETISTFAVEINKTASNAYRLLQNLLDWARLQRGKMNFEPEKTDIYELINEVEISLSKNAELKNISVTHIPGTIREVVCDSNMTRLIIRNLLSNAIKYSNTGGKVEIKAFRENGNINISVTDNGIGIPPEVINQLFKIDANISTYGTARESGTGLGLILCKDMADIHKGKIIAQSTPGLGSTFTFSFPNDI